MTTPTGETQPTAPGSAVHLFFWVNSSLQVDIFTLSECSEYFRALSHSGMREMSESLVPLDHVSSSVFYHFLEFSFYNRFIVPVKDLDTHIQVWGVCELVWWSLSFSKSLFVLPYLELSSYLLAETFLSECLSVLEGELSPDNCCSYLSLAQEICCEQLKRTVFTYMSRNMLEMHHLVTYANPLYRHCWPGILVLILLLYVAFSS